MSGNAIRIVLLADNLASEGLLAEHGFSAWIEATGRRILFDTGQGPALEHNAPKLGIPLRVSHRALLFTESGPFRAHVSRFALRQIVLETDAVLAPRAEVIAAIASATHERFFAFRGRVSCIDTATGVVKLELTGAEATPRREPGRVRSHSPAKRRALLVLRRRRGQLDGAVK